MAKKTQFLDHKSLGWIKLVGAVTAGFYGWTSGDMGVLILSLVVLLAGIHHLGTK